ncbi:MAG: CoB--CoM heterodisulfide reductase iron-sulfur subunit A family protein [Methanomicrobiales archaeon]|nr:CoB--CoM heterodisulfide reductase iron-sulfur subunit A family protein [Methanomicrobiales archaeon]NYT21078.1 CoB--CoM heterodisulfide reductase iron-sulfur subunit A family protein [Methanomicrobiales archaeon]
MSDVVIIGGGVTGIQAALDLADHGIVVHLIEREPSIGGHMAQLDKTFPTNDCSMCILSPKMLDVSRHPNIRISTCTEVIGIEGEVGDFRVRIRRNPRYVDEERCNGCGDCIQICPVEVYNQFDAGIGVRKAIYKPHSQAVPDIVIKDNEHCIECGLCYDICGREAIRKEDTPREEEIRAASIIIASGYDVFDAARKEQFGYLRYPDVITSLEFERMMNASGPTGGSIRRLSDGKTPDHVVFVQCVGSRDIPLSRPYCSGVCCMYAMKNAMLLREKYPGTRVTILYMDVRAYGKGYEEYFERAKAMGVEFVRGMPAEVIANRSGMLIRVENTETGAIEELHPGLVVLSVGLEPAKDASSIAAHCGIPVEDTGFFKSLDEKVNTVATIQPGIYIAGTAVSPRDIPDCVAQAQAAAMRAFLDAVRDETS